MASVQVLILQSGRSDAYGLPLTLGSVVTVDRDYAVSLVSAGFASWTNPADAYDGETNLRKPSESYDLFQCGVPFVIFAGDGGGNGLSFSGTGGEFTLSAAVLSNFWNLLAMGGYAYFPAGAGGLATGGLYWCKMTSDTAGQIYAETYSGIGKPAFIGSPTALPNLLAGRITQSTSEIALMSFTMPGGSMGPNGILNFVTSFFGDPSASTKTYRVRGNGNVTLAQIGTTTNPVTDYSFQIRNRGTTAAQFGPRSFGIGNTGASIGGTWQYAAINTDVDQTLSISVQLSANTATAMLAGLLAEVKYGA